jgi:hypothetical protein
MHWLSGVTDPGSPASPWSGAPTAKERNALQREVVALLDELAPEKVLTRGDPLRLAVEQHRTPTGCVLQAPSAALTVSWFGPAGGDKSLGQLRIIVWQGTVSRRGSPAKKQGATVVRELVFHPIERPTTEKTWRDEQGQEYDTAALAALCLTLLKEQTDRA